MRIQLSKNLNDLLKDYKNGDRFNEVMKFAKALYEQDKAKNEADFLNMIEVEFGPAPVVHIPEDYKKRPLEPFGRELIDPKAIAEMREVMELPPVTYAALMPDAHPMGKPGLMPVGGVMAMEQAIMPSAVGVDISCQVWGVITDIPVEEVRERSEEFADIVQDSTAFGKGAEFAPEDRVDHPVMDRLEWDNPAFGFIKDKDLAYRQLGSSGAGNHFYNIMELDLDIHISPEVGPGKYTMLMSHSGSRKFGFNIAKSYSKIAANWFKHRSRGYRQNMGYLPLDSEAGSAYFLEMTMAGRYADANHEIMHEKVLKAIGGRALWVIRSRHNFAFISRETGWIIHRKGATPAAVGQLGLLPGSSGTKSYVTLGQGHAPSLNSSAHGAGRVSSRADAERVFDKDVFEYWMKEQQIAHRGIAPDENPFAYKDIEKVVDAQEGLLTKVVGGLQPIVVVMGAE